VPTQPSVSPETQSDIILDNRSCSKREGFYSFCAQENAVIYEKEGIWKYGLVNLSQNEASWCKPTTENTIYDEHVMLYLTL
jgi:hypothetical protein